jgi:hypothetical protein
MTGFLSAALVAQSVVCGTYGATPGSPGGCTVPNPGGRGGAYLQQINGQLWSVPLAPTPTPYRAAPVRPSFYQPPTYP